MACMTSGVNHVREDLYRQGQRTCNQTKDMNTLLEAPAHEVKTTAFRHDADRVVRSPSDKGRSAPVRLKPRAWIEFWRDDVVRTHWRKVWRSMAED